MRVAIPVFPRFTSLDIIGPYQVLVNLPDVEVVLVAESTGIVTDDRGLIKLSVDATFDDVDHADVLVVPGGPGSRVHGDMPEMLAWIQHIHASTTWTTSVCTGSLLLGAAGLLDGLTATTHFSAVRELQAWGATYVPDRVVTQGKIITAAGVSSGIDMALTLAALLTDQVTAEAIQLLIEYDPQPPFAGGSVASASEGALAKVRARLGSGWEPYGVT
ncbi:DJ-1/PfpI family protein [Sanguibacter gelidistatuariae]|uniref:DJ-1/PfpI family protein n=1 Tax=Sanguibacter gelidistatuariae TaxID=1814289 RepID=A0A1G6KTT2_9MICO|nr:DJ-1/PfpI family protein [Sanguibacter gelidistatuariae]SDC34512.1 DJ-1/PfpI family protein [Sanguibacter gelidistatuariae]